MRIKFVPENIEVIARDLEIPWSMDFSPDGQLFFTERVGRVNTIINEKVTQLLKLDVEAREGDESGLLGIVLDSEYLSNKKIYLYYTYREKNKVWNRVSCFLHENSKLTDENIIIDKIPGGRVHNGGRIKFGPDGKLYITTGETWHTELAQDLNSLGGKILRVNKDGSFPEDNPFKNSPIFSYGNRNSQGLAWHPETGVLYTTEHGPSGEKDWYAHDEINIIEPGKNYGWPYVIGNSDNPNYANPIYHTGDETWAPSGATFYKGYRYKKWINSLFVANLRGNDLRVILLKPPKYRIIESIHSFFHGELGRLRDVMQAPDGYLYICTSNRDGRGDPYNGDDLIGKIKNL